MLTLEEADGQQRPQSIRQLLRSCAGCQISMLSRRVSDKPRADGFLQHHMSLSTSNSCCKVAVGD